MSPQKWIAAAIVLAAVSPAYAGKNEINSVTFDETAQASTTLVHVRSSDAPTFTVYKLERPSRVVIDMPGAKLSDVMKGHDSAAVFTPNTWAVSTIAAQQLDDNVVRVIVTMARPGRYDVKSVGNEVVLSVIARDAAPAKANPEELAAAKAEAEKLRAQATESAQRASAAQKAVEQAKNASAADLEKAKQLAAQAKADADAANARAANAQAAAEQAKKLAQADAQKARDERAATEQQLATMKTEAERAKAEAAQARRDADAAKASAGKQEQESREAKAQIAAAKAEAAQRNAEAIQARKDADAAKATASKTEQDAREAKAQVAAAKAEAAQRAAEAASAKQAADRSVAELASAKQMASAARKDADSAKRELADAKAEAQQARRDAEAAKQTAEKTLKDARAQLAMLDQKTASAQAMEDKARAANAAAQAREEAARDAEAKATQERIAAEAAAKQAQEQASKVAAGQKTKAAADARAAEQRLADAKRATEEAEAQRVAAQTAAAAAKKDLEQSRSALALVEQQRATALNAADSATKKKSDAEAAASDAARRRAEAEAAVADAAKKKKDYEAAASDALSKKSQAERDRADAEAARLAAQDQAKTAREARDAAEKQRRIAERAAEDANAAKHKAESSLAELTAKRDAAEKAATELELRSKAEAKAQADMIAAQSRKANDAEIAAAKTELAKLEASRKQAEADLADRRKAVALQQAEATRLESAANRAHDAAGREEARRAELAQKRSAEEAELQKLATAKAKSMADADDAKVQAAKVRAQVLADANAGLATSKKHADDDDAVISAISNVAFEGDDGNGVVDISMSEGAKIQIGEVTPTRAELIVDNASLAKKLERTLDVSRFGSPVRSISTFHDPKTPNRVRMVAQLAQPVTPTVDRSNGQVKWHFLSSDVLAKRPVQGVTTGVTGFGAASTPVAEQSVTQVPPQGNRRRIYHGPTVDFEFKDAPIHDLLRILGDTGHINIVVPESINANVTVRLKRVPWDEALEVILQSHGLWYRKEGNIYRIATQKELDAEDAAEAARREAALKTESPRVERYTLNYANATEMKQILEPMLSAHGKIEIDTRTNSLIINDVAGNRAQIIRLANELDTPTPQISIEARIVEARSTFTRQIGVQWGGNGIAGAAGGNATGLVFPSNIAVTGANSDSNTIATGVAAPSDFAVNLPAATGAGEGGAIGFSLGSIGGNFNINLRLSALEDTGTVRIISAPKITVSNNKKASISQGVSIPISVVSAAGTNTQFVQADLALTVQPYVSNRDCAIAMDLTVTKNEPDFVNVGARGDPTILRKEAKTNMLIMDGETAVLGGIYTRNSGVAYKKVPLFGDIPVLGWLFKNRSENDDRTEILVFITPKITNKASLLCTK